MHLKALVFLNVCTINRLKCLVVSNNVWLLLAHLLVKAPPPSSRSGAALYTQVRAIWVPPRRALFSVPRGKDNQGAFTGGRGIMSPTLGASKTERQVSGAFLAAWFAMAHYR